jgi:PIN domain
MTNISMHVFIDTNILLNFFHFSKDQLHALTNVFASHEHGAATVHLTQQVRDEFKRNREGKIKDALKRFSDNKFAAQLPSFMKSYEEYEAIQKLSGQIRELVISLTSKVNADIAASKLEADALISDIFSRSRIIETTPDVFATANMRVGVGNPPGKNGSLGDAINWTLLLENVPDHEPIHIISADGDYFSVIDENAPHPFLQDEWKARKQSSMHVYRTLDAFLKKHFDGVAFPFNREKDALIDDLASSGSYATTHHTVAELEAFSYFSLEEVERVLDAVIKNSQVGGVVGDDDVSDFISRIALPRLSELKNTAHAELLDGLLAIAEARRE